MNPIRLNGETRVVGGAQAGQPQYHPLSIRDMPAELVGADGSISIGNCMVTAWRPTADEFARLMAGAPVYLSILGDRWPPVNLFVGELEGATND